MTGVAWWVLGFVAYGLGSTITAIIIGRMIRHGLYGTERR